MIIWVLDELPMPGEMGPELRGLVVSSWSSGTERGGNTEPLDSVWIRPVPMAPLFHGLVHLPL